MTGADEQITAFLEAAGWGGAARAALAGDASPRRYDRLRRGDDSAVLMIAPPQDGNDVGPFCRVTDILRDAGLSAPRLLARDEAAGLLLLEDLGDDLIARLAGDRRVEHEMYAAAVDVLAGLRGLDVPGDIPPYDDATYRREAALLPDWYMRGAKGDPVPDVLAGDYLDLVSEVCAGAGTDVLVLRDYHAENLLWLPERAANARVGLLDYQDALGGHAAYDLVSLLEDARRDTSATLRNAMIDRYITATGVDKDTFMPVYNALGAQRNLKIVGIFSRLCLRDGKDRYLALIPRVWDHLMRDLSHPPLAELRAWVMTHVPPPTDTVLDRIRGLRGAG